MMNLSKFVGLEDCNLCQKMIDLAHDTWDRIQFTRANQSQLKLFETTLTQNLLFELTKYSRDCTFKQVEVFEAVREKTNGNDIEFFMQLSNGKYLFMPMQAKILYPNSTYEQIPYKNQNQNLIDYANKNNGLPLYLLYNYHHANPSLKDYGCSIVDANLIKKYSTHSPTFDDLHVTNNIASPWYVLICNSIDKHISLTNKIIYDFYNLSSSFYTKDHCLNQENWKKINFLGDYVPEKNVEKKFFETEYSSDDSKETHFKTEFLPRYRIVVSNVNDEIGVKTMSKQSESILEANLIKQLSEELGYEKVTIKDEEALTSNLRHQLQKHNKTVLSDSEFAKILNHLSKGNVFEKAKILRDKFALLKDDGTISYIEFLDNEHWCQNLFQVTQQVTIEGKYKNRYDVTILINGLPLVQIELKRRGIELKEAFNQINRYQRHSYGYNSALFNYVQLFVISNGVNTKYYANNKIQSFKQTFFWADKNNKNITNLEEFTQTFLERCHISKMICNYIVLAEVPKILMVLRPYQYHAVEAIIDRVQNTNKNGYIWHTTGSGKTLTSFKASQILVNLSHVEKVVFVVDRKDLDYQTSKEFNSFSDGSVDGTDNTKILVDQFLGRHKNKKGEALQSDLIITTIQKLNTAISKKRYLDEMEQLRDKKIIFIFDECHRSQFGETHLSITKFFNKAQLIGFTGTPIFPQNAVGNKLGKRTTAELFDESLHRYVITDAISDENVLKFSIEYVGRYKEKESANELDIEVEDIDTQELLESKERVEKITDYIIANHDRKTHAKEFTAMMCVSSVNMLIKYYESFRKKNHNLKIATIFSYSANEDDKDATGLIEIDETKIDEEHINKHSREKLDEFIEDYNGMFGSKYSTKDSQSFYNYYNNISKRVKEREIDILLVVNMFLTGFDSKTLNTLYADKNLKYHGLIQAFSRTNRILNELKSQGNIVSFRNLKKNTDDAIALFSDKEAKEIILMKPYEDYVTQFNQAMQKLLEIAPSIESVDAIIDEEKQLEFIKAFRDLMRNKNILEGFADFEWGDLSLSEQGFEDYKSKYLDLYEKTKSSRDVEKVSVLNDVDFELELIHKDEINVSYILKLLSRYKDSKEDEKKKQRENILSMINGQAHLRSKRELIERFIDEYLLEIEDTDLIESEFDKYVEEEKGKAFDTLCHEENLDKDEMQKVVATYLYDERAPLSDDIYKTLNNKPKLLERKRVIGRVMERVMSFIGKFYN